MFEPEISRAMHITVALIVPLVIAHYMDKPMLGIIPAITAQLLATAKIEVTLPEKILILLLGGLACSAAAFIGTLSAASVWSAVLFLGLIAGIASMARGIAEYGQVFGISSVILFLISLYPPNDVNNAFFHALLVLAGVMWAIILSLIISIFTPQALSKATATPWYFSTLLIKSASHPKWMKKNEAWISQKEIDLRKSINNILPWIRRRRKGAANHRRETLKLVRASSRLGSTATTLQHELKSLSSDKIPLTILLKIKKCTASIAIASENITDTIINPKHIKVVRTSIRKATFSVDVLIQSIENEKLDNNVWVKLFYIVSLYESAIQYQQDALLMLQRIEKIKGKGSLLGSSDLRLKLKEFLKKTTIQFQPDSLLLKHSLRVTLMTSLGLLIYYLFNVPRGYWIVLTIMVLLQPEFGNTWEKARDRMSGTLLGGLIGTFLLMITISTHFIIPVLLIGICCFFYSLYQNKNYRIAVIFITIMLVLLLDLTEKIDWHIAVYRLLATIIGGLLAVAGAYFLWPSWETLQFPFRISKALTANKNYLNRIKYEFASRTGFHPRVLADKRKAEIENINLEESLKVMRNEPYRIRKKIKNAQKIADLNKLLTKHLSSWASFLPELKNLDEFPEAIEFIDLITIIMEKLSAGIVPGESRKIKNELEITSLVMEAKLELLKDHFDNSLNPKMTLETWILPYELVVSELKKIAAPIKEMILLTDDMIEIENRQVAKE
jgi:uncharacterized membrane protein YccC